MLRTYRRAWSDAGGRVRQAPPAAVEQLRAMVEATDPESTIGLRDRALLILWFSLMARRSELADLHLDDVREVPEGLVVRIRKSKTDQDAVGVDVAIPYGSHVQTCPVRTVRAWRDRLAEHGITSGPLLRSVDKWGFVGESLSGDGIRRAVRATATRAGLPGAEDYSAHSLRAGGATSAAWAGVPTAVIARHGRWSETSPVVHNIRPASRSMAGQSDGRRRAVGHLHHEHPPGPTRGVSRARGRRAHRAPALSAYRSAMVFSRVFMALHCFRYSAVCQFPSGPSSSSSSFSMSAMAVTAVATSSSNLCTSPAGGPAACVTGLLFRRGWWGGSPPGRGVCLGTARGRV